MFMDLYYISNVDGHLLVEKTLRMVILIDAGSGAQRRRAKADLKGPGRGVSAEDSQAVLIGITTAGTRPAAKFWNGSHAIDGIMTISAFISTVPARAWASGRWH
jgi:hypothetical protein